MSTIGQRIKKLREEKLISQTELAEKADCSKQTLYKYENDIITNIPISKIESIAKALNTTPAYLMGWEEIEKSEELGRTFAQAYMDIELREALPKLLKLQPNDQKMVVNLINSLYEKVSQEG